MVLPHPPFDENTRMILPRRDATIAGLDIAQLLGHGHGSLARADERLDVVGHDDLANAGTQRLGHRRDLHASPHEDDAEERTAQTVRLGDLRRDRHGHVGTHHDEVLVRVALEVLVQFRGSLDDGDVVGQREPEPIGVAVGIP